VPRRFCKAENNRAGLKHREGLEPAGDNILARVLNFSNATIKQAHEEMEKATLPKYDPQAEPTTALADKVSDLTKAFSARVTLAEKALDFIDAIKPVGESGQLRQQGWLSYVTTLLGVKMLQKVKSLPATKAEAWLVRRVALTGLVTLGGNAGKHADKMAQTQAQKARLEKAAKKMESVAIKSSQGTAKAAVGEVRVAALGAVLNLGIAVMRGYQVQANATARGASELVGDLLQTVAGVADFRASAYEKTIYSALRSEDIYKATAWKGALSEVNAMQLRALRMTAFRFALPAALISIWWDASDAWTSGKRKDYALMTAQIAGVVGTIFTVAGIYAGIASLSAATAAGAAAWATAATVLGLVGAVIAVGVIVAIMILKEEEWVYWLKDNPLNKERKGQPPIHDNLMDTLQKLANVKAELQGG